MTVEVRPVEVPVKEKTVADVLRHAARIIEERGWSQGEYESEEGAVCALGAIYTSYGFDPGDERWGDETEAELALSRVVGSAEVAGMRDVPYFNDTDARTASEVTTALRAAADAWEAENA